MKNDAINRMKESKKKIDLLSGKHLFLLLVWIGVYLVVWFQPDSTLRTWVLLISALAIVRRIWAQGRCTGMSEVVGGIIENLSENESSSDKFTAVLQEIGNAGIKVKIENKKAKEKQE